jgi:hypothetical protein
MMRLFMISSALALALAVPAAAQRLSVSNALERLHTLCEPNYKPALSGSASLSQAFHRAQVGGYVAITRNGGGGSAGSAVRF